MISRWLLVIALLFSLSWSSRAHAISGSDAILTVGGGALFGSILGASTLPFYENTSEHTKNIWVGAAVGAVAGVLVAAAVGFSETSENIDEEIDGRIDLKTKPEFSPALAQKYSKQDMILAWSPITTLRF